MIYFLRCNTGFFLNLGKSSGWVEPGSIKIGTTVRLSERMTTISAEVGHAPSLLGVCSGSRAEEKSLHDRFGASRKLGEWFDPCDDLLRFIESETGPWDGNDEARRKPLVRIDDDVAEMGRKVAAMNGLTLGKYFEGILKPALDRELEIEIAKLSSQNGSQE